jgi:hypothetical protein
MQKTRLHRRLLCQVLRRHHWQTHRTEDGGQYSSCSYCHTDNDGITGRPNLLRGW